jgi:hypothetical protein
MEAERNAKHPYEGYATGIAVVALLMGFAIPLVCFILSAIALVMVKKVNAASTEPNSKFHRTGLSQSAQTVAYIGIGIGLANWIFVMAFF